MTTVVSAQAAFAVEPPADSNAVTAPAGALIRRLERSPLGRAERQWVLAALHSEESLAACARGEPPELDAPRVEPPVAARPQPSYLSRVEVRGFRGIGPTAVLDFPPAPGLTVVVGRNGSGKSSFAEAVEAALTGRNLRWEAMPTAWRDGWRNLHYDERTEITVDLHLSGGTRPTRITRAWRGDSVRSARGQVLHPDGRSDSLTALGWGEDLVRYRPFLSYDELGRAVTGRATELYDTLTALLGLTELAQAERTLAKTCERLAKEESRPRRDLPYLMERLRASADPRARRAAELLSAESIDLERLAAIAADAGPADPGRQVVLRRLRRLSVPERSLMNDVVNELRGAAMELAMQADTKGERARGVINLLRQALEHHERHPGESRCPACSSEGALDARWAERTRAEIARMEPVAGSAAAAHERAERARDQARFLLAPPPSWLPQDSELGRVWAEWSAGADMADLTELADHIENMGRRLRTAATTARKQATERLSDPTDGWAELAEQLSAWLDDARSAVRARAQLGHAGRALEWFAEAARELRQERLRPVASRAEQVWQRLRQERHIDLEALRLVGRGAQRRVAVDVSVDGGPAAQNSPGLLSQGEFQALALSICLPRTLLPDNPFGFLILDDPVQAMDTETVEGLAAVLSEVGRHRQLVVFTHDTRLPDALRRARLPAAIRGISRDAHSNVWVEGEPSWH